MASLQEVGGNEEKQKATESPFTWPQHPVHFTGMIPGRQRGETKSSDKMRGGDRTPAVEEIRRRQSRQRPAT